MSRTRSLLNAALKRLESLETRCSSWSRWLNTSSMVLLACILLGLPLLFAFRGTDAASITAALAGGGSGATLFAFAWRYHRDSMTIHILMTYVVVTVEQIELKEGNLGEADILLDHIRAVLSALLGIDFRPGNAISVNKQLTVNQEEGKEELKSP